MPTSINKWVNNGWAVFDMSVYLRLLSPSTWNLYVAFDNGIYLKLENKKWATSWQNIQNGMCAQQRLRSIWASARSDQESLLSAWRKLGSLATHWAHSEDSWVFAGCTVILLVLSWGGSNQNYTSYCVLMTKTWLWHLGSISHHTKTFSVLQVCVRCNAQSMFPLLPENWKSIP